MFDQMSSVAVHICTNHYLPQSPQYKGKPMSYTYSYNMDVKWIFLFLLQCCYINPSVQKQKADGQLISKHYAVDYFKDWNNIGIGFINGNDFSVAFFMKMHIVDCNFLSLRSVIKKTL